MKRFIFTILLTVCTLVSFAQEGGPLKFLGIPIDGTKEAMIFKLKGKGFRYNSYTEELSGQFNGKDVSVYIHTNHNLVDRIYVAFPSTDEYSIKYEYNRLFNQLSNTGKYMNLSLSSEIPADEDISYEMTVNHKRYEASFSYIDPDRDPIAFVEALIDQFSNFFTAEEISIMKQNIRKAMELPKEEQDELIDMMMKEMEEASEKQTDTDSMKSLQVMFAMFDGMRSLADGSVWFTIHENYGKYYIGLYYDNIHNQAHGEDL